jgi:hypothetical protein
MDIDKIGLIAQEIIFAFEDHFNDENKRKSFDALFHKYLSMVDPGATMQVYDAIILLGRKHPAEFEQMVKEMRDSSLISG